MREAPTQRLRVLIAEDSEELRTMLNAFLQAAGHVVTCVGTGKDAIRILENHYFDLLVTDVIMPDADGIEVIGEAKRRYPTTRIVVITGGGHALGRDYCLKLAMGMGAHAAVLKPFTHDELSRAIKVAVPPEYTSAPFPRR